MNYPQDEIKRFHKTVFKARTEQDKARQPFSHA